MTFSPGSFLGPYEILAVLGRGGMGEVYRAKDKRLNREVAIKVLRERLEDDPLAHTRFEREVRAVAALSHPNILAIHEFNEDQDTSYAVMELLQGETLRDRIHDSPLPWHKAVEIGIAIADGLSAAHSKGIIHRDLKPENIFLTSDGQVKILDFGLARIKPDITQQELSVAATESHATKSGIILGTVPYMSPEQIRGSSLDARSDIFSFGSILYEMVTGRRAYSRDTSPETMTAILKEDPLPLEESGREVPSELSRTIRHCLEKNPEERFQSTHDLAYDLKAILNPTTAPVRPSSPSSIRRTIRIGVIAFAILGIAGLVWWFREPLGLQRKTRSKSIAVLPFKNVSLDKSTDYFTDGMTEDIITQLSKIRELKVISRTSIMRYKNSDKSLLDIGRELNVTTVLEGSVRKEGDQIRVTSQLIDAQTDEHIWAETYDRKLQDVFKVQSEVAQQIAGALKIKLSGKEKEQVEKKPTQNVTAYDYYLKGRDYYMRFTKEDNENAVKLFEKAIELDPGFALAYAGLSRSYGFRGVYGLGERWYDSQLETASKAISLDPNLPDAYKALGNAYGFRGWNTKALDAYKKMVELNPNHPEAASSLAPQYAKMGKLDEALRWAKKAVELEPAAAFPYFTLGEIYFNLGIDTKGEYYLKKSLELQPDFTYPNFALAYIDLVKDQCSEARNKYQKIISIDPPTGYYVALDVEIFCGNLEKARIFSEKLTTASAGRGYILWKEGRKEEAKGLFSNAEKRLQMAMDQGDEDPQSRFRMARLYAVQGSKREAYSWLQKAIDAGWVEYRLARIDPMLENLRSDPQFQQMMARVEATLAEMRKRADSES